MLNFCAQIACNLRVRNCCRKNAECLQVTKLQVVRRKGANLGNAFDVNRQVAQAYVRSEQLKGWFLSNAKMLLVALSGIMLFLGVTSLAWGNRSVILGWAFVVAVLQIAPVAVVGGLLAICIEGGTVFSSAMRKDVLLKVKQELEVLEKANAKYKMKVEVYDERKRAIVKQIWLPNGLMAVCAFFSVTGAEIFWQKLLEGQPWYLHATGVVLGLVCSALLMIFELNSELVERVIERCIASCGLIEIALDQSAKSQIHDRLFRIREEKLASPEFDAILQQGAEQGLLGVVTDAVRMAGMNVTAQQLQRMVNEVALSQKAADQFIASGGTEVPQLEAAPVELSKKRQSRHRKAVEAAYKRDGEKRMLADLPRYATELGMDQRTLERHLKAILGESA